jgi:ATP-dependent RNA helicase RhlE
VDGIAHVVNYDLPQAPEDFIHRVGRTGRAGAEGMATTFATSGERGEIRNIERTLKVKLIRQEVPAGIAREDKSTTPVIVMPRPGGFKPRGGMSFKPGRRKFGSGR